MISNLQVQALSKRYKNHVALDAVSIDITTPQCIGLIGRNGAGKTTLLRLLAGADYPSSGIITINGRTMNPDDLAIKATIGYAPEYPPVYPDMTVEDYFSWCASMRDMRDIPRIHYVLNVLELWGVRERKIQTLSKGLRQRLGFGQAWLHQPSLILLDEPTSALDPHQQQIVLSLIKQESAKKIVILSSHQLGDIEALCDRIIILKRGRVVLDIMSSDRASRNIDLAEFFIS